jgi:aryl-alcohol dehydrogenase-like predicted oxidoreductase
MGGTGWRGSWGPQDDEASIAAIHTALDGGITWFDTAAVYGLGHSEEVLGRGLGTRRADVVVATKCARVWDAASATLTTNGRYASIMREADASLRRLRTDYIDLYQMHWPDPNTPIEESLRAMEDLVAAGKVRYVGVCNFDVPLLARALTVRHVDSLQPPYNMLRRDAEAELLPYCREHGIGVVAYSALASGLLGGRYTAATRFEETDWRSRDPRYSAEALQRNAGLTERLGRIAARHGKTVAQLAVAWVLANPAVTSAIVGVRKPEHITGVLPAADWRLDGETLAEIDDVLRDYGMPAA